MAKYLLLGGAFQFVFCFMKNTIIFFCSISLFFASCTAKVVKEKSDGSTIEISQETNMLADLNKDDLKGFQWMNEPDDYSNNNTILIINAKPETDFFNDPNTRTVTASAPFLFKEYTGDFVATALLKPDFKDMWNALSIMVHIDERNWIKFAFENSDATGKSIVSVVTRDVSDDANGVILNDEDMIWLKIARLKNNYALHWSLDGENYKMARLSAMPHSDEVKVGVEAQCPVGEGAKHEVVYFYVEEKSIDDLRKIDLN